MRAVQARPGKGKSKMAKWRVVSAVVVVLVLVGSVLVRSDRSRTPASLWDIYEESLKSAEYVDLTHTINPSIPVWHGFGPSKFAPLVDPARNQPYTYKKDGFEATHYDLSTDQLGTQLDPSAHWNPYFPAIDELPATYTFRPLVVIPTTR